MGTDTRVLRRLVKKADKAKTNARKKRSAYEEAERILRRAELAATLAARARKKKPDETVFLLTER